MKKNRLVCLLLALVLVVGLLPVSAGAAEVEGYLSDVYVGPKQGFATNGNMTFYPTEVSTDGRTVTAYVPDSNATFAAGAKLSSSAPAGSTAKITYTDTTGADKTLNQAAGLLKKSMMMNLQKLVRRVTLLKLCLIYSF